jgi:excisionase family DNA binding protein
VRKRLLLARRNDDAVETRNLPILLTVPEVAELLRTSRKAIYAMIERGLLPGVVRIGRRVLVRSAELVNSLDQKSAPSLKGDER